MQIDQHCETEVVIKHAVQCGLPAILAVINKASALKRIVTIPLQWRIWGGGGGGGGGAWRAHARPPSHYNKTKLTCKGPPELKRAREKVNGCASNERQTLFQNAETAVNHSSNVFSKLYHTSR